MWGIVRGAIGIAAGTAVGNALGNTAQQGMQQFINPLLLPLRYAANNFARTLFPDMSAMMPVYQMGMIDEVNFSKILAFNNIPLLNADDNMWTASASKQWRRIVDANLPKLSLAELYYLLYSQQITKQEFLDLAGKYRFSFGHAEHINKLFLPKFDQGVIATNYFRGYTKETPTLEAIQRMYGCNRDDAEKVLKGFQFVPPPTDVLRFIVKDVYDDAQIKLLGLDDEYDTVAPGIPWANAAGITKDTTIEYEGKKITRDILKDYWISHWQLMSPTQGYVALQRLRPNRIDRYAAKVPGLKPFEFPQLNALLKSNDYVPEQRKWLAASSFLMVGRIDLRRLYESDTIDDAELYERYQDLGYAPIDARLLTDWSKEEKRKRNEDKKDKEANKKYSKFASEVYASYMAGAISRGTAYNSLLVRGFDEETVLSNLDAIDLGINRKRVETYVKMVKREMFLGLYTGQEAYVQLVQGGLQDIRANQYVIQWQRELSLPRRMVGVNTILDWVKRGLINFPDAKSRLEKLGLSNSDTLLYLEQTQQDIEKRIQIEQINIQRTEKQQQKEIDAFFKQLQSAQKAAQAQLRTYSSPAIMKRWLKNGLIDWGTVEERLRFLGIPDADIVRYRQEMIPNEEE